jgi:hypothetical protein
MKIDRSVNLVGRLTFNINVVMIVAFSEYLISWKKYVPKKTSLFLDLYILENILYLTLDATVIIINSIRYVNQRNRISITGRTKRFLSSFKHPVQPWGNFRRGKSAGEWSWPVTSI